MRDPRMRLFVRAAGWKRGYYWTEATAEGPRDAGQVPVDCYFELLRNQDSLAPSLSLYQSANGYYLLCLGLSTRRNESARRIITNSLLIESPDERSARLLTAAILAIENGSVFRPDFEEAIDHTIDHDETQDHYRIDAAELHRIIESTLSAAAAWGEPEPFPDDVFVERLYARNSPERRRELQAALCRYELPRAPPDAPPEAPPGLVLAVAGLEDAANLVRAGAWIVLSERCVADTWTVFAPPGSKARTALLDRC